jgi:hypothetical protein
MDMTHVGIVLAERFGAGWRGEKEPMWAADRAISSRSYSLAFSWG